ncbi:MAG TPA: hypothetical protein VJQ52_04595 [Steroidobacteraceae bacterium]|nr:hypothetical protein [Steroidobacteraceae bacterium]
MFHRAGTVCGAARHDSKIEASCIPTDRSRNDATILETRLAGVPALLRAPPRIARPPIVLWHGAQAGQLRVSIAQWFNAP